ncbi:MAG TPA: NAD+ synthase [Polyangiaceae bacterium]|jgi:NAD+ synthetase|nr:NAD+ synthase [Polyangiaceae bacterium]
MKVALLQLDPTIGAIRHNADRLLDFARMAARGGAEIAVGSELSIVGYPPRDLLDRPAVLREIARETERVVREAPRGLTLVFGSVLGTGASGLTANAGVVARDGVVVTTAQKRLLPTYDVFDDARYFEPGKAATTITVGGVRFTIAICEDAWAEVPGIGSRYRDNPLGDVRPETTDVFVNLSASPFTLSKLDFRPRLFGELARRHGVGVVLVNQVGGNDELLFDGRSTVWNARGEMLARAPMFEESCFVTELDAPGVTSPEAESRAEAAYRALVMGVRDYTRKCGFSSAVIGLSGGIDSALTAAIAADALGPERVLGVSMPTRYSSEHSLTDARVLAENLGIGYQVLDIEPMFRAALETMGPLVEGLGAPGPGDVTWENVQARIRGATLMAVSNRSGAMVLTTGNKSELACGYCTLYGDMVGGLAVISDVPKTMVYELSRWVNRERERIPLSSIEKPPSAELRPDQKDEDSLPPYPMLDAILELFVEQHRGKDEIIAEGFDPAVVSRVLHMVRRSEYKRRQAAPGLIITGKAFGPGRRVPVAEGFTEE